MEVRNEVDVWLGEHGLTEVAPKFQRLGYRTLETLTMMRDDLCSGEETREASVKLEITSLELPSGFRRMFEAGLRKLTAADVARCLAAAGDSTKPTTTAVAAAAPAPAPVPAPAPAPAPASASASAGHNKIEKISGFYCPITLDLMKDPVIDREGNTFERKAIEDWIRLHGTSPITRQPATLDDLRPNRSLQESIKMEMALEGITVPSLSSPATTPRNSGPAALPKTTARLKLGDIVVKGNDWQWDDQNGGPEGRGVVMSEVGADNPGWVKVLWAHGFENLYRYGADGKFDLRVLSPEEADLSLLPTSNVAAAAVPPLAMGTRVARGVDWEWDDQDGNGFGVTTCDVDHAVASDGERHSGWVSVRWDHDGSENNYRWGDSGAFDLRILTPEESASAPPPPEQLPPIEPGSVVVRGPDWKYRAQDSHGRGITLGPVDSDGWVTVLWHNGQENKYRWGEGGKRDVRVLSPEEAAAPPTAVPDASADGSSVRPGTIVVRGPDWRWAEQDGGEGSKGKTVGCVGDFAAGWVEVKWLSNGDSYRYRYGADDSFDIHICVAEGEGTSAVSTTGSGASTGPASATSPAILTVGSRVMRGPDWVWGDAQDQNGMGTITSEIGAVEAGGSGWVRVKWDKTLKENNYRYGEGGAYDLCVVKESEQPPQATLAFGTVVEPGADWKWGNQNGGGTGSVVGESTPGWVRVRWTKGGQTNSYRYGADGAFDIKVVGQ